MTERVAYVFMNAAYCQECGEHAVSEGVAGPPLFIDPAEQFEEPETWFCENCGEPLFPKLYAQATGNPLWDVDYDENGRVIITD